MSDPIRDEDRGKHVGGIYIPTLEEIAKMKEDLRLQMESRVAHGAGSINDSYRWCGTKDGPAVLEAAVLEHEMNDNPQHVGALLPEPVDEIVARRQARYRNGVSDYGMVDRPAPFALDQRAEAWIVGTADLLARDILNDKHKTKDLLRKAIAEMMHRAALSAGAKGQEQGIRWAEERVNERIAAALA